MMTMKEKILGHKRVDLPALLMSTHHQGELLTSLHDCIHCRGVCYQGNPGKFGTGVEPTAFLLITCSADRYMRDSGLPVVKRGSGENKRCRIKRFIKGQTFTVKRLQRLKSEQISSF